MTGFWSNKHSFYWEGMALLGLCFYFYILTHLRHIKSIYSSFMSKYPLNPSELKIDEIEQFRVGSFFNGICKKTVDVFTM